MATMLFGGAASMDARGSIDEFTRPAMGAVDDERGITMRRSGLAAALVAGIAMMGGAAYAGDCNTDIAGLSQKRQSFIDKLNVLSKAAKGKLDPEKSCPQLRGLVVAEGALLKYLEANKNWCNVPDNALDGLKSAAAKSQTFATQACTIAAQVKKQQQQQASGGGGLGLETQKLPTGPL